MSEDTFLELIDRATEAARTADAPLGARLATVADEVRRLKPQFADVVERMIARLSENGVGLGAPKPGERMPDFVLVDESGHLVNLLQLLDRGPAIISFNRGHWCPFCRLNVDALAKAEPDITMLGAQIVAVLPETVKWNAELKAYAKAPFRFLSDIDNGYALEMSLLFWVGDEMRHALMAGGVDIPLFQGNDTWMLPIPATFVVGRNGFIRARHIDPDYRRRMEIEDLINSVRAESES